MKCRSRIQVTLVWQWVKVRKYNKYQLDGGVLPWLCSIHKYALRGFIHLVLSVIWNEPGASHQSSLYEFKLPLDDDLLSGYT